MSQDHQDDCAYWVESFRFWALVLFAELYDGGQEIKSTHQYRRF